MTQSNCILKRMGVMNITPNSFSDGGELTSEEKILKRLAQFGEVEAVDIGAESTAPMNKSISAEEEWERLDPYLPIFASLKTELSIDTYHPETIFKIYEKLKRPLIWNDISGKFDDDVQKFLSLNSLNQYVFCHNLAPTRETSGQHMNFISLFEGEGFLEELANYFRPHQHEQVIFDPCLGFSKTYEQNWLILDSFGYLQEKLSLNKKWLLGFSRKSFLRKRIGSENITDLDRFHEEILSNILPGMKGILWLRTHRPELVVY